MNDTCMPMSSERECQIIGDGANVAQAVNYIAALVQQVVDEGGKAIDL